MKYKCPFCQNEYLATIYFKCFLCNSKFYINNEINHVEIEIDDVSIGFALGPCRSKRCTLYSIQNKIPKLIATLDFIPNINPLTAKIWLHSILKLKAFL